MINPFKKTYSEEEIALFKFLQSISLFKQLNYEELVNFLPYLYLRKYNEDEAVFFRNDPSHALYLIKEGLVSLSLDVEGKFETIAEITSRRAFGSNALIEGARRNYNCIVMSSVAELYVIPHVNIRDIFSDHPKIKAKMMTALASLYDDYTTGLFKSYRSSIGFFKLSQTPMNL